jgi:uncharacterized membrane protein (UPF0127 family)
MKALVALGFCLAGCRGASDPAALPTTTVSVRGHVIQAEVAAGPDERERGLMFRRELADDAGMLFVYPEEASPAMWMHNTFIPLSVAFVDAGHIVHVEDMEPFDDTLHHSPRPVRVALQVRYGWLATRGLGPGDPVSFDLPDSLRIR